MGDVLGITANDSAAATEAPPADVAPAEPEGTPTGMDVSPTDDASAAAYGQPADAGAPSGEGQESGAVEAVSEAASAAVDKVKEVFGGLFGGDDDAEEDSPSEYAVGEDTEDEEATGEEGATDDDSSGDESENQPTTTLGSGPHTLQVNVKKEGADVNRAAVSVQLQGTSESLPGTTNASGFATFNGLVDGTYVVNAVKDDLYMGNGVLTLPTGVPQITIELKEKEEDQEQATLNVDVFDEDGNPVSGADITVDLEAYGETATTDAQGKATIGGLPHGDFTVFGELDGRTGSASVKLVAGQVSQVGIRLVGSDDEGEDTPGSGTFGESGVVERDQFYLWNRDRRRPDATNR